ncbi:MAG: threonine/serine ThrE exporter family protein [Fusobacteriaceae bacterium]
MDEERRKRKEKVYRLALFVGELILRNGGETNRVERLGRLICESEGFRYASIYVTPTLLIVGDDREHGVTFMKNIKERGINLMRLALVNAFVMDMVKEKKEIDFDKAIFLLKRLDKMESYSYWTKIFAVGFSASAFVSLFSITPMEGLVTFLITSTAVVLTKYINAMSITAILGTIISCFYIGICSLLADSYGFTNSYHTIIIGSILPFLPGVSITKSISDLVSGELISGSVRAVEAFLTALSIGIGIGGSLHIWKIFGGVING